MIKRAIAVFLALCLLPCACPALGEDSGLLDALLEGIEGFDPLAEEPLSLPLDEISLWDMMLETGEARTERLDVLGLQTCGYTADTLFTDERSTYLPVAALVLGISELMGYDLSRFRLTYRAALVEDSADGVCLMTAAVNMLANWGCMVKWVPGSRYAEARVTEGFMDFMSENLSMMADMQTISPDSLDPYYDEIRRRNSDPDAVNALVVGKVTFELSPDRQSIFIDRPAIRGGSGKRTIAYNIYDSDSQPVNYFYSDEERVAATPGYGGLFNVFVVVTDLETGENDTQNIGWQTIAWPHSDKLKVGKPSFTLSPNARSIYLNRPSISCASGQVSIAYNIYDDRSNPVNYFFSTSGKVAATPGYKGIFNVYVVVTDTGTGEQVIQDIGWQKLGQSGPLYRALLIGQEHVPNNQTLPGVPYEVKDIAAALGKINDGGYEGNITSKLDISYSEVLSSISEAYSGSNEGDVNVFFISTHGVSDDLTGTTAQNQEGALACGDGRLMLLSTLADALSKANPNNELIVVISACGSGAAVKDANRQAALFSRQAVAAFAAVDHGITVTREVKDETGKVTKRREFCRNRFYVMTASDVYQDGLSIFGTLQKGSLIGLGFIQSLTLSGGCMKADTNKDHKVTFDELFTCTSNYSDYLVRTLSLSEQPRVQRYPAESSDWVAFWN